MKGLTLKKCTKCKKDKEYQEFRNDKAQKDGKTSRCKECLKASYYASRVLLTKEERKKAQQKEYKKPCLVDDFGTIIGKQCNACKDLKLLKEFHKRPAGFFGKNGKCIKCVKEYDRSRYIPNPRIYQGTKKEVRRRREKIRRIEDPQWKAKQNISRRIRAFLKGAKSKNTQDIIGLNKEEFWNYLCTTFEANYGIPREWVKAFDYEIDHIIPISTARNDQEIYKLNHYTNLQLLLKEDNRKKNNCLDWQL